MSEPSYKEFAKRKQDERWRRIPSEWRLANLPSEDVRSVLDVPRTCGLLSADEIQVTEAYDAVELAALIRWRDLSAVQVVTAFCKRAAVCHQLTNCLTEIFFDDAIKRAEYLDAELERNGRPVGPLHGVPVSLKDTFDVEGYDSSIGLAAFVGLPAKKNSPLVAALLSAGAVLYCKTNIPQTLGALDSVNNIFGRTLNPMNRLLTAGGSSGGEGALIAMRGSVLGIGTDIGGSIRIPAMCNGIVGVKPSAARISPWQGTQGASNPGAGTFGLMTSCGPMATTARSCELLFKVLSDAKLWEHDSKLVFAPWRDVPLNQSPLTFLVLTTDLVTTPLPPIQNMLKEVSEKLSRAGHRVVTLSDPPKSLKNAQGLMLACLGLEGGNFTSDLLDKHQEPKIPWLEKRLKRSPPKSLDDVYKLFTQVAEFQNEMLDKLWTLTDGSRVDAILCPVAPHPTPFVDAYNAIGYTGMFNMLDWPAAAVPARPVSKMDLQASLPSESSSLSTWDKANRKMWAQRKEFEDMPMSVQVVGRKLQEEELMLAVKIVEECLKNPETGRSSKM